MSTPRRRVAAALALTGLLTVSLVVPEPAYAAACTGVPSDFDMMADAMSRSATRMPRSAATTTPVR